MQLEDQGTVVIFPMGSWADIPQQQYFWQILNPGVHVVSCNLGFIVSFLMFKFDQLFVLFNSIYVCDSGKKRARIGCTQYESVCDLTCLHNVASYHDQLLSNQ